MAAGLGFKDFVTGEVLTAADVDGYLMQGIWVFASAAARDAAVTSPQEGNACYLKDTNEVLTYSGSAWVAVGGGGGGGLTLIVPSSTANSGGTVSTTAGVVTASGVSSVSLNGVFSSTYVNYMIQYNELNTSSTGTQSYMRLRASGTDNTSSTYSCGSTRVPFSTGSPSGYSDSNAAFWTFNVNTGTTKVGSPIFMNSPFVAVATTFSTTFAGHDNGGYMAGYHSTASSFDGFTIYPSTGTLSGIFRVYGISN
jgi:hypothetical protein